MWSRASLLIIAYDKYRVGQLRPAGPAPTTQKRVALTLCGAVGSSLATIRLNPDAYRKGVSLEKVVVPALNCARDAFEWKNDTAEISIDVEHALPSML